MGALLNVNINVENLPKEKFVKGKKGIYYSFIISMNDETNQYGQNVTAYDSQTKEEREAKKPKNYLGNGKVIWTDGKCVKAEYQESQNQDDNNNVDLPF
jgi:coenzyme F420-reducing hydrogenase alpha subunit